MVLLLNIKRQRYVSGYRHKSFVVSHKCYRATSYDISYLLKMIILNIKKENLENDPPNQHFLQCGLKIFPCTLLS
jgi:hypothetical protein